MFLSKKQIGKSSDFDENRSKPVEHGPNMTKKPPKKVKQRRTPAKKRHPPPKKKEIADLKIEKSSDFDENRSKAVGNGPGMTKAPPKRSKDDEKPLNNTKIKEKLFFGGG